MYYAEETVNKLRESECIIIYGAGIVAKEVANCLTGAPYYLSIKCFMVSEKINNPSEIMGIPVIDIREGEKYYQNALIVVAVMEKYLNGIRDVLKKYRFNNIIVFSFESDLWSEIRGNYYRELRESQGKQYVTLEKELNKDQNIGHCVDSNVHIYRACSHLDSKLQSASSEYDWEIPIQVGSSRTAQRICAICDNCGENISDKNEEYCELTALYWIWKNDISKYAGLCHYRRHFELDREMIKKIAVSDIDVILTIPILNFPDVRTTYVFDHIEEDWEIMLQAIEKLQPLYYQSAVQLQNGVFYYAYNMFIARKKIFDDYCEWLFPILSYCEKKSRRKTDSYQKRYIGFLSERLMSIYFLYNEDKLKIVHAKKHFME